MESSRNGERTAGYRIRRALVMVSVFLGAVLVMQAAAFLRIISLNSPETRADAVVVFRGSPDRIAEGFRLVGAGRADRLMVSPASAAEMTALRRRYRRHSIPTVIIEPHARTTFENALYSQRLVEKHNLRSIILVTSWNHMPRSYVLMRALLRKNPVAIHPHPVSRKSLDGDSWYRHNLGWKMVHNEMVEFWGSLAEGAAFAINGETSARRLGQSRLASQLKKLVLFDLKNQGRR